MKRWMWFFGAWAFAMFCLAVLAWVLDVPANEVNSYRVFATLGLWLSMAGGVAAMLSKGYRS